MIRWISTTLICLGLTLGISACGKKGDPKFGQAPVTAEIGVHA